jgi:hypothetical protein
MNRLDGRGVSDLVAVLISTFIIFGFSMFYMLWSAHETELQTWGIVDAVRASEHRQNQLLSYVYHGENAVTNTLRVYMFNYGSESAEIDRLYLHAIGTQPAIRSYYLHNAITGEVLENVVPPKTLVRFTFPDVVPDNYWFTLVTKWKAVYSWRLGT